MKTTINFKKATLHDREFLLKLRKASMVEHLTNAGIELSDAQHFERIDEFYDDSNIIYKGNEKIGLIKLGSLDGRFHIRQFQIMPSFHNYGIGSKVLSLLIKKAEKKSLSITLNVLIDNPALNLYLRNGFAIEGETKLEYQMRWSFDKKIQK
ncbi:MAG: GNAT family N-acetyltransferase [Colwelliaceae bacterium]|nr:GNAT family N-acetyltransferase [Colwelliaceae bacterium]